MLVRLAFSIATTIEPEVLLIDEVLGVGDMAFQEKARRRMRDMMARAELMIVVSHDLNSLIELCERGVWLDHGKLRMQGPMAEVVRAYRRATSGAPDDRARPEKAVARAA
jgi:ABC-type polysaccharide/polyol phosphate transport system ATPase subunit